MKIIIASILSVVMATFSFDDLHTDGKCRQYNCVSSLAQGKNGTQRYCADFSSASNTVDIQACDSNNTYRCPVTSGFTNPINCTAWPNKYPTWRYNMAAGDTCYGEGQCFGSMTCGGSAIEDSDLKVCLGNSTGQYCNDNRVCNAGLYCNTTGNVCAPVLQNGANCTSGGAQPCSFGNSCYNGTCTAWGQVEVGKVINIPDPADYDGHTPFQYNEQFLCESFFALSITGSNEGNYVCAWGDEPNFSSHEVKDGNTTCSYTRTNPYLNNTKTNVTQLATCGYNENEYLYCPKTREESFIRKETYSTFWNTWSNLTCNLETSLQYCGDIEGSGKTLIARPFMAFIWRTTGTNYALIADNPSCVADSLTENYWHILAGSMETMYGGLAIVAMAILGLVL